VLFLVREVRVGPFFIFIIFVPGSDTFAQSFDIRFFRRRSRLHDNVVIEFNGWWRVPRRVAVGARLSEEPF
jgi:hypothetical protein